jgi:hypothetical protein
MPDPIFVLRPACLLPGPVQREGQCIQIRSVLCLTYLLQARKSWYVANLERLMSELYGVIGISMFAEGPVSDDNVIYRVAGSFPAEKAETVRRIVLR